MCSWLFQSLWKLKETSSIQSYNLLKQSHLRLKIIRSILNKFDHEKGKQLPPSEFAFGNLWSIVLFTSDETLCNQFQKDSRNSQMGCKWAYMGVFFYQRCESIATMKGSPASKNFVVHVLSVPDMGKILIFWYKIFPFLWKSKCVFLVEST